MQEIMGPFMTLRLDVPCRLPLIDVKMKTKACKSARSGNVRNFLGKNTAVLGVEYPILLSVSTNNYPIGSDRSRIVDIRTDSG